MSKSVRESADEWAKRRKRDDRARGQCIQRAILGVNAGRPGECGLSNGADIEVGSDGQMAWSFRGWQTCGWADCAYCGPLVRLHRMAELTVAVTEAEKLGWLPIMLTLAPPHRRWTPIEESLSRIEAVWSAVGTPEDKTLRKLWRKHWAIKAFFVARECTLAGMNGAHPHHHLLLFIDPLEAPAVAELLDEFDAQGVEDEQVALLMPTYVAEGVGRGFLEAMEAWSFQRPKNGVQASSEAVTADRAHRQAVIDGWTSAGVQAVPAGAGAATYLAKLTAAMSDEELRVYASLTGFELTNASAAKVGGLSTTTAMAILGAEWADAKGRVRRPHIKRWIAADERRREIAETFAEWREATRGKALLEGSPGYYKLLPSSWEHLSDEDIASRAGEVFTADKRRQELWRQQQEAHQAGCVDGGAIHEPHLRFVHTAADDLDSDWARTVYLDPLVVAPWAEGSWDDIRAGLMALHDEVGPWGMVSLIADAWTRSGEVAFIHEQEGTGAVRVGRQSECWRDGSWWLVPAEELSQHRAP